MVVVNDLQPYGAQRVALTVARCLARMDHDVELLTLEPPTARELQVPEGVTRRPARRAARGPFGYVDLVRQVRRLLSSSPADVVISHMVFSNLVTLAAMRLLPPPRRPVLVTEHSTPSTGVRAERSPRAITALARRLYPSAAAVVGVSPGVVVDTAEMFRLDPRRLTCILNPVDVAAAQREAAQPVEHPWLHAPPAPIVCVGGFRAAKGQDVLVRALEQLPGERVVFVGDGPLLSEVKQLARRLGLEDRIDFVGYRADARAFMARGALVAVPSRWEGFGLVAVEAAAVGRWVVGSDVAGLSELVPRYVPGELVPAGDPGVLAAALRRAVDRTRGGGDEADLTPFDPMRVAASYLAALARSTGDPPSG